MHQTRNNIRPGNLRLLEKIKVKEEKGRRKNNRATHRLTLKKNNKMEKIKTKIKDSTRVT